MPIPLVLLPPVPLLVAACVFCGSARITSANEGSANSSVTGSIEGTITYQADAKRPWRYARYYVRPRRGELAGAVVAVDAPMLRKTVPPKMPATVVMDQKDQLFSPETIAIRAGDRIRFTNSDAGTHNITSTDSLQLFSASISHGQEFVQVFPKAGGLRRPIVLGCVFHGQMRAWVFVFDHPHYQQTAADGRFRLANIPPGEYRLEIAHPPGALRAGRRIEIKPGSTLRIDVALSPDHQEEAK